MIYRRIGRFATHYRYPILIVWVAAAILVTLIAPNIDDVASSDQADFLPAEAPFKHADDVYVETFPESFPPGGTIIVFDAREAGGVLDREAEGFPQQIDTPAAQFIAEAVTWLNSADAPAIVKSVSSPLVSPLAAELMIAPDNQIALLDIVLSTSNMEDETIDALAAIDDWLAEHAPDNIATYQTGSGPIVTNTTESAKTSADRTIWVTLVLVVVLLLAIYRSPVSPVIPLLAVTVSYLITRGIVAYMGQEWMTITSYANVILVVVMYGAGTDYCLFLISRFREELADNSDVMESTTQTVHRVGETITSSAGTIFVGFMAMVFAEMGIFNTSGPALALGVIMALLAGLTFVPALLAVLGQRAFWPGQASHRATGRFYEMTSKFVSSRPLITIIVIVGLMLPLAIYGISAGVSYDLLADLPDDKDSVVGYNLMAESLGAGNILPMTVVITDRTPDQLAPDIAHLTDDLLALDGIDDVRSLNLPLGQSGDEFKNLLRVDVQLRLAGDLLGGQMDVQALSAIGTENIPALLQSVNGYFETLATTFPGVAGDPNLLTIREILSSPPQLIARQNDLAQAIDELAQTFENGVAEPYLMPLDLLDTVAMLPGDINGGLDTASLQALVNNYLSTDRTAFKMSVILEGNPISTDKLDTVTDIRAILEDYERDGEAVLSGGSAINADIRDTMDRDLLRAIGLVMLGIFIVLLLMLRSVIAPLYLIATVVLSFTFTLGLTNLVFKDVLFDVAGLTWYVPFFVFVFLVALGVDYSIFLIGRIKEEIPRHGIREGVHVAVAATGAIITSAGIILAGTFAALMAGEVMGLLEMGFAVSVGVLIDTFVVRTMLVPAITTWLGPVAWWPGGVPGQKSAQQPSTAPAQTTGD